MALPELQESVHDIVLELGVPDVLTHEPQEKNMAPVVEDQAEIVRHLDFLLVKPAEVDIKGIHVEAGCSELDLDDVRFLMFDVAVLTV